AKVPAILRGTEADLRHTAAAQPSTHTRLRGCPATSVLELFPVEAGDEGAPLSDGEGQHGGVGVLGVAEGCSAGKVGDFEAVLVDPAVTALAPVRQGDFDAVVVLTAVTALPPRLLLRHWAHSSRDLMTSLMNSRDFSGLNAEP